MGAAPPEAKTIAPKSRVCGLKVIAACLAELAATDALFTRPRHPYTRLLLDTVPDIEMTGRQRQPVVGEVPNPIDPPPGCAFHPRCPFANQRCRTERPSLLAAGDSLVACHAVEEDRL